MDMIDTKKNVLFIVGAILVIGMLCWVCASGGRPKADKDELLDAGDKFLQELEYGRALVMYQSVLNLDEKCAEAYVGAVKACVGLGDHESASKILNMAKEALQEEEFSEKFDELLKQYAFLKEQESTAKAPDAILNSLFGDPAGMEEESYSLWFDGIEMKVLERIDENSLLVKFALGDYLIQTIVPDSLEEESFDALWEICDPGEAYEVDFQAGLGIKNVNENVLIFTAYGKNPEILEGLVGMTAEYMNNYFYEDNKYSEIETINHSKAFLVEGDIMGGDYGDFFDTDEKSLSGYGLIMLDLDEQLYFIVQILNKDADQLESIKQNIWQTTFRRLEEDDFVYPSIYEKEDYDAHMDCVYTMYNEILNSPDVDVFLQEHYGAVGSDYDEYCFIDLTGDGIPEVVVKGNPKQYIIIGENGWMNGRATELEWTNEEGVFYSVISFAGKKEWNKCKLTVTDSGGFQEIVLEDDILAVNDFDGYLSSGEAISEEKYEEMLRDIEKRTNPHPRKFNVSWNRNHGYRAAKEDIYNAVRKLAEGYVIEP